MTPNKFHLASRFGRREELRGYMADLEQRGHEVTSRWIKNDHESTTRADQENAQFATEDVEDVHVIGVLAHSVETVRR